MDDESVFLGIDFGTSKCVMSWYNPKSGRAEIIRNSNDREETPSLIYFGTSKKDILVGQDAVDKLENTVDFSNCQFVSVKRNIKEDRDVVLDDGTTYTPEDLVKGLFLKLKRDAELFPFGNQPTIITRAVITYPELFDEPQQERIQNAARAAGFAEVKLLSEPTAAVIAYCSIVPNDGKRFLVYDFGAGTANIAIIERIGDKFLPLGSQPRELSNCGGDNLDQTLYEYCERLAYENFNRPISFILGKGDPRFLRACRKRKEILWSFPQLSKFPLALLDQDGKQRTFYTVTLDRKVYENDIKPEINKTIILTKNILDQTIARSHRIDKFLVIGGTSRIPLVTDLLAEIDVHPAPGEQPQEPSNWPWERNFVVALGAAYWGQKLWGVPRQEPYVQPLPEKQAAWVSQDAPEQQPWSTQNSAQQATRDAQGAQQQPTNTWPAQDVQQPAWNVGSTPDPWAQPPFEQQWDTQQPQVQPPVGYDPSAADLYRAPSQRQGGWGMPTFSESLGAVFDVLGFSISLGVWQKNWWIFWGSLLCSVILFMWGKLTLGDGIRRIIIVIFAITWGLIGWLIGASFVEIFQATPVVITAGSQHLNTNLGLVLEGVLALIVFLFGFFINRHIFDDY